MIYEYDLDREGGEVMVGRGWSLRWNLFRCWVLVLWASTF